MSFCNEFTLSCFKKPKQSKLFFFFKPFIELSEQDLILNQTKLLGLCDSGVTRQPEVSSWRQQQGGSLLLNSHVMWIITDASPQNEFWWEMTGNNKWSVSTDHWEEQQHHSPPSSHVHIYSTFTFTPFYTHHRLMKAAKISKLHQKLLKRKRRRTSAQRLYPFHKYIPAQSSLCRLGSWSIIRSSLQVSTSGLWHQSKHDVRGGGCVDEGVGSVLDSNFSVNWHLRWLATVTTRCSLTRLLSWGWEKPHGWFQVTLEVQCSPAETQNIC